MMDELSEIRERHQSDEDGTAQPWPHCRYCHQQWPCDVARLIAAAKHAGLRIGPAKTTKVYLAWDDTDYYGPNALEPFVHATLAGAQRAIEQRATRTLPEWKWEQRPHNCGFWEWGPLYYVQEVEVQP